MEKDKKRPYETLPLESKGSRLFLNEIEIVNSVKCR
jgi:hypothetical protein